MNVFLDDERMPYDVKWIRIPDVVWTIVRDLYQFKDLIDANLENISFISFDHDLGQPHYPPNCDYSDGLTGFDCAKYLVNACMDRNLPLPDFVVHSLNPVGAVNIQKYLENFRAVHVIK